MQLSEKEIEMLEAMLDDVGMFLDRVDIWVTEDARRTGSRPLWAVQSYTPGIPINLRRAQMRNAAALRLLRSGYDTAKANQ